MKTIIVNDINDIIHDKVLTRHGGCSRFYINKEKTKQQKCYKVYRNSFTNEKRKIVKSNYMKQGLQAKTPDKISLVIPDTLYTDHSDTLLAVRMQNYPYGNLINTKNKYFYTKEYPSLVSNFMQEARTINEIGIITDLKESNVLVTPNLKPLFIDNDFTFLHEDVELTKCKNYLTNVFGKAYLETFGENAIYQNYNDFVILYIAAKLLLEEDIISSLIDKRGRFTVKSLLSMQRFLQKDKAMSSYLRKTLKNLASGENEIIIDDIIVDEVHEFLTYRYKKRL